MGSSCPYRHAEHHYCDECGSVAEYDLDGDELCEDCLKKRLNKEWDALSDRAKMTALGLDDLDEMWSKLDIDEKAEALRYDLEELGQ